MVSPSVLARPNSPVAAGEGRQRIAADRLGVLKRAAQMRKLSAADIFVPDSRAARHLLSAATFNPDGGRRCPACGEDSLDFFGRNSMS